MFYTNFIKYATKMDMSPSAAAEAMGYQRSVITRWKQGAVPRLATLQKVADFFGCTPNDLLAEDAPDTDITQVRQAMRDRQDLRTLFDVAMKAPPSAVYETIAQLSRYNEQNK